jgi:hypothetical protein
MSGRVKKKATHFEVGTRFGTYPACNPHLPEMVVMTTDRSRVDCNGCRRTKPFKSDGKAEGSL